MKKIIFLLIVTGLFSTRIIGQTLVDVVETTFKISGLGGEEVLYYGFAEGDQLILNFQEVNGKELKEIEIIELPSSSKFMDLKSKKIENKILNISRTGIYKFRLFNSAIGNRICKVKIQRIPASEATKNFATTVFWKTVYDTTYTTENEKYLFQVDTVAANLTDQVAKVHSQTNLNGSKTSLNFILPKNTIAWSYYIGVDQAGQKEYENAVNKLSSNAAPLIAKIPGYGPMAALALGSASYLTAMQTGEDIDYYVVDGNNVNLFYTGQPFYYIKKGKVINDYSRMTNPIKGSYHICLSNDNTVAAVTVSVKVTAITVNELWKERQIKKIHVSSKQVPYLKI